MVPTRPKDYDNRLIVDCVSHDIVPPFCRILTKCIVEERCTDRASSCFSQTWAVHTAYAQSLLTSHRMAKAFEGSLGSQEAIFQLRLLTTNTVPSNSLKSSSSPSFISATQAYHNCLNRKLTKTFPGLLPFCLLWNPASDVQLQVHSLVEF